MAVAVRIVKRDEVGSLYIKLQFHFIYHLQIALHYISAFSLAAIITIIVMTTITIIIITVIISMHCKQNKL